MKKITLLFVLCFFMQTTIAPKANASLSIMGGAAIAGVIQQAIVRDCKTSAFEIIMAAVFVGGGVGLLVGGLNYNNTVIFLNESQATEAEVTITSALQFLYPEIQDHAVYQDLSKEIHARYLLMPETLIGDLDGSYREVTVPAERVVSILKSLDLSENQKLRIVQQLSI